MNYGKVYLGTRGSALALQQSRMVKETLEHHWPGLQIELRIIKTMGDKILDVPLGKVGGKGLFVKEIEEALLAAEVDLAVHSMKDVPAELPQDLMIGAVPRREDPRDVLVSRTAKRIEDLSMAARVGTSSLRRGAQLLRLRPDLRIEMLRGNLDTRLRKVQDGLYDAIVLAAAGLHRMGWQDRIAAYLDPGTFIPAIGQGALGIEVRRGDSRIRELITPLHHPETAVAVEAERSFLEELQGGCQVPIGGHAIVLGAEVELTGLVSSVDGSRQFRSTRRGSIEEARSLGLGLARELLEAGAGKILKEVYEQGYSIP